MRGLSPMSPASVNPFESVEVVYSHEVPKDSRFDGIHGRIKKLEDADRPTESWLKRNIVPLCALVVSALVLVVAFLTLIFGPGIVKNIFSLAIKTEINSQLKKPTEDIQKLQIDLAKIGVRMDLREHVSLTPGQFKIALPQLSETLKKAKEINAQSSPEVRGGIQSSLRSTDTTTPGYWQATAQFISYQSEQETKQSFESQPPRCYDKPPAMQLALGQSTQIQTTPKEWRNCTLDLEEEIPQEWADAIIGSKSFRAVAPRMPGDILVMTDCLIRYHGGTIPARLYEILGVTFLRHCLLEFSFGGPPTPAGQRISQELLASSSLVDVRLSSSRE
jgi:hypothetical protein